jgi:flagellar export protein FliJ
MSRFTFSLQRVLDLRERREQEMAAHLSAARRAAEEARQVHESIEGACNDGREHLARVAEDATRSAGELQYLSLVLEHLSHHAVAARDAREAADAQLDQSTDAFAAAARARHVLDKLRERHQLTWQQEQARADQQGMDAIALTRHIAAAMRSGGR